MSNLKNLKEILNLINEKKDPIINMYLGDTKHSFFIDVEKDEASIEVLSTSGKAKVDAKELDSIPFKKEYEITIKRVLNKERALEVIVYNTKDGIAVSKKYKKLEDAVEVVDTTTKVNHGVIDDITANTAIYSFDKLREISPNYNYEEIPVQVISAILNCSLSTTDVEPDNKSSFSSNSINTNGTVNNRTRIIESDNSYDETIYPFTDHRNLVLYTYNEYLNGSLRPSVLFEEKELTRNK